MKSPSRNGLENVPDEEFDQDGLLDSSTPIEHSSDKWDVLGIVART